MTSFKDKDVIDAGIFQTLDEFTEHFAENFNKLDEKTDDDDDFSVAIVAKYNVMINIINYLIKTTNLRLEAACLVPEDEIGADAYFLEVFSDGSIYCETVFKPEECAYTGESLTYVSADVSSRYITINRKKNYILFDIRNFEFEEDFDDDDEDDVVTYVLGEESEDDVTLLELLDWLNDVDEIKIKTNDDMLSFAINKSEGDKCSNCIVSYSKDLDDVSLEKILSIFGI